jgi:hypothetical protein
VDALWQTAGSRRWSRITRAVPNRGPTRRPTADKVPAVAQRPISRHPDGDRSDSWHQPTETLVPAPAVPRLLPNRTTTSSFLIDPLTIIPPVAGRAQVWIRAHAMAVHADTLIESLLRSPCRRRAAERGGTDDRSVARGSLPQSWPSTLVVKLVLDAPKRGALRPSALSLLTGGDAFEKTCKECRSNRCASVGGPSGMVWRG